MHKCQPLISNPVSDESSQHLHSINALRYILILSAHLCLGLTSNVPLGLPTRSGHQSHVCYTLHPSHIHYTLYPSHVRYTHHPSHVRYALHPSRVRYILHPSHVRYTLHPSHVRYALHPSHIPYTLHPYHTHYTPHPSHISRCRWSTLYSTSHAVYHYTFFNSLVLLSAITLHKPTHVGC